MLALLADPDPRSFPPWAVPGRPSRDPPPRVAWGLALLAAALAAVVTSYVAGRDGLGGACLVVAIGASAWLKCARLGLLNGNPRP